MQESESDKRARIVETALKLFGRKGYYGARMSEIAQRAKVSPKTLYKYFAGKKQLFMAARDVAMDRLFDEVVSKIPGQPQDQDSLAIIKNALKSYSEFIRENRGMARVFAEAVAMVDEEVKESERESFQTAVTAIALMMEDDVNEGNLVLVADPEKTAVLFLSLAALLIYAVMLDLDRKSVGDFDPASALDLFVDVMHGPASRAPSLTAPVGSDPGGAGLARG